MAIHTGSSFHTHTTPLSRFHPIIADWFRKKFKSPTDVQAQTWPVIASGQHTLIVAPTGSGKTFAAFLACIDSLLTQGLAGTLEDRTQVLYISPLKAPSNNVQKNLQTPLTEITEAAIATGHFVPELRIAVRTGDTPAYARQKMLRTPPHILITTPESLCLLLTGGKSREMLRSVRTVIIDEIHAVAPNKRGSHLALSIERLEALTSSPPIRVGLSATQRPITNIANFLAGRHDSCRIIDSGHRRAMDLAVEVPKDELGAIATNAMWKEIYARIATLANEHQSTLVFVNTRRLAERVGHHLAEHLGDDAVATHRGSLSQSIRLTVEEQLKRGQIRVVVATASLELGIDIGTVDLVCQIGSTRVIAACLQRVGRSRHMVDAIPKGRLFATTRAELIECAALIKAIRAGRLDTISIPSTPLDILAQQIVAEVATQEWHEDALFKMMTRARPYHNLTRSDFDAIVRMLADGISTRQSRCSAYLHYDRVNCRLRARRGARLAAATSGGAIPDIANYAVVAEPEGIAIGSVDEDFAVESLTGDIILLDNTSWKIQGVESGKIRVEGAHGAPPNIPFWRGEAPSRTIEFSTEVVAIRKTVADVLKLHEGALIDETHPAVSWLQDACGLDHRGSIQAVTYIAAGLAMLGTIPTHQTVVAERFFDEGGGMQLVIHSPFGYRVNRAWGLALRKRFCVSFDFELQAAATDDGIVLSFSGQHSFPLDSIFRFLHSKSVAEVVIQAMLQTPLFPTRWRWNATRSLALLRFARGQRIPPQIQRMQSEDLMAAVFPLAVGCQDKHTGMIEVPDHPLVRETVRDCLTDAMDIDSLRTILQQIEHGEIQCVAVESPAPSPFCHEILNSNPYSYLDDAPLEERRTRAVNLRRSLSPDVAGTLGALDPAAIETVIEEAWPVVRDADELHDALLTLVWVPDALVEPWKRYLPELIEAERVFHMVDPSRDSISGWVPTEHLSLGQAVFPNAMFSPPFSQRRCTGDFDFASQNEGVPGKHTATLTIIQGWVESIGPTTAEELAGKLTLPLDGINTALLQLEMQGQVLRGKFRVSSTVCDEELPLTSTLSRQERGCENSEDGEKNEWCDRRLLARIHRRTLGKLRKEIEPVSSADFMRFLVRWQHVAPESRLHGEFGLLEVIRQLAGFEAAASTWERGLLSIRVEKYCPGMLDQLCLRGLVSWGRLSPHARFNAASDPERRHRLIPSSAAPLTLFPREDAAWLLKVYRKAYDNESSRSDAVSAIAQALRRHLDEHGASFFLTLFEEPAISKPKQKKAYGNLRQPVSLPRTALIISVPCLTLIGVLVKAVTARAGRDKASADGRCSRQTHMMPLRITLNVSRANCFAAMAWFFATFSRRESLSIPWWNLLVQYRRLESKGEIRGGHFVSGFTGEQFALAEALESLRAVRRSGNGVPEHLKISTTDPLNLVGIITPGQKIPAQTLHSVILKNGVPQPTTNAALPFCRRQ